MHALAPARGTGTACPAAFEPVVGRHVAGGWFGDSFLCRWSFKSAVFDVGALDRGRRQRGVLADQLAQACVDYIGTFLVETSEGLVPVRTPAGVSRVLSGVLCLVLTRFLFFLCQGPCGEHCAVSAMNSFCSGQDDFRNPSVFFKRFLVGVSSFFVARFSGVLHHILG